MNICQNEGLSEERQLMTWVGIFQVRIFWVASFQGGILQWEVSSVGNSWVEIPPGGIEPSSSYDVSILILQKIFNRYSMTLNS